MGTYQTFESKYMFLRKNGKAIHQLGDISRDYYNAELIVVNAEENDNWIGHFAEGYGFVNVRFDKKDCKEASSEEVSMWCKDKNCIVF